MKTVTKTEGEKTPTVSESEDQPYTINTVDDEVNFFKAALHSKPVGLDKHLAMAGIVDNFYEITGKAVASEALWRYFQTIAVLDALDEREDILFQNDEEDLDLTSTEFESNEETDERKEVAIVEEKQPTPKVIKDYSRVKEKKVAPKKKEEIDEKAEKIELPSESDEEDTPLKPAKTPRKSKVTSSVKKATPNAVPGRKDTPKRSARGIKDEKESSPANTSSKKEDEEVTSTLKREKVNMGKRSLRSRGEDEGSNKSSSPAPTPPPTKRPRRI